MMERTHKMRFFKKKLRKTPLQERKTTYLQLIGIFVPFFVEEMTIDAFVIVQLNVGELVLR